MKKSSINIFSTYDKSSTRPVAALALALLVALTAAVRAAPGGRFLQIPNYISPFLGYAPASPVYNLPLKFLSNAKPVRILSGALDATPPFVSSGIVGHFPALSKVLRLPLKYVSNAKPMRVFFKKPFQFL
ncbi:uncharacterized protein [Centruroides vittatus]|uniref:uncharacterized protein isoform X2 n=1 Tax=Centruroides vittatus TaxID=120091 RepID=UPI0035106E93